VWDAIHLVAADLVFRYKIGAARVHPEWRSYLLAASVHALHGSKSDDTPVLVEARKTRR
jgi:hypothetical protein